MMHALLIALGLLGAGAAVQAAGDDRAEWRRLNEAARPLYESRDTAQALGASRRVLDFALAHQQTLGPGELGTSWHNFGQVNFAADKFPEAREAYEKALPLVEKAHGASSEHLAIVLNSLASVELRTGHYSSAEKYARRALDIAQAQQPQGEIVAQISNTLAWICFNQQRYAEAADLYETALKILQQTGDSNNPLIAMLRSQLAAAKGGIPAGSTAGAVAMAVAADSHAAFIEKIARLARQRNEAELLASFDEPTRKAQEVAIRQHLDEKVYRFFSASTAITPQEHVTGASTTDGRKGLWHYGFIEDKKHKLQPFALAIIDSSDGPRLMYIDTGSCVAARHPPVGPCK